MSNHLAPVIRYRLGQSNTFLSPIGIGTWQFSQGRGLVGKFWPNLSADAIQAIVATSLTEGINWFDTAEIYGNGQSEAALASALDALNVDPAVALIATKWWPLFRNAESLKIRLPERQRNLHQRPITLYQIHQPYARASIASQMRAMAELLDAGLIGHAGVSNFSRSQMIEASQVLREHGHALASNQVRYHLLDRRIETTGLLAAAKDLGTTIIAYSPLAQGLLSGKFHAPGTRPQGLRLLNPNFRPAHLRRSQPLIDVLTELGARYHASPAQVALNWLITTPGEFVLAIPGATRPDQARSNAATMSWRLSASDRDAINQASAL